MKKSLVVFIVAFAAIGLIAGPAAAAPEPPAGYETKRVKEAGLTVAIPETFEVVRFTRKEAQAFLDANPQLREAGATVDSIRKTFSAAGDFDGDGKGDVSINVRVERRLEAKLSPTQARAQLTALGYREVSASRTRVAGHRAVVADYVVERTGVDGTTRDIHFTEYVVFESPPGVVHIDFERRAGDEQYEDMIDTMIDSVRFLKK